MKMKNTAKIVLLSTITSSLLYASDNTQANLNKITVTAQKVEENIQDVPIAITAFNEFDIEDKKIKSVDDIARYTPNFLLSVMGDMGIANPSIRGLSSDASTTYSTVSMFIDGVPNFINTGFDTIIHDVERIEVLKGPQGTLYGKGAEAGVVNIITKKPTNETKSSISLEVGSDDKRELSLNASGAIIKDTLYLGLSGRYYEKDGFLKNTYTNRIDNDREDIYGKINLRYTPNENLEISLISSKFERDDGTTSVNSSTAPNKKEIASDLQGSNKSKTSSHALKVSYDIDKYRLESITTYKRYNDLRITDNDFKPIVENHTSTDMLYKNSSQELKLSSSTDKMNWLVGVYGDKAKKTGGYDYSTGPMTFPSRTNLDDKSLGLFTHATYKLNDKLSLIGGIRYDRDKKEIDDQTTNVQLDKSYKEISPKFALNYKLNNNTSSYFTVAKGYKSGGFYIHAPSGQRTYDKETLWNYEIGIKSIINNKLTLNSAIYYMDISDMQILTSISTFTGYISNAASATSKGAELDLNYNINDSISLFGAIGYNQTKLDNFSDSKGNYSGNYNPYAPKYNFNIGMQYRDSRGYFARADFNGYGKTYADKENKYEKKAYELLNLKLGYESDKYDIYLYGKNVFDKEHHTTGCCNGSMAMLSKPREIGIQLNYRF